MSDNSWKIHKFGGSSLRDAACFKRVAGIIESEPSARLGVVVSAMGGMTDQLLGLVTLAERDSSTCLDELQDLGARYADAAKQLVSGSGLVSILDQWSVDAEEIQIILKAIAAVKSAPHHSRDVVAGYGEIWSARLLAALLAEQLGAERGGRFVDARKVITVRHGDLGPAVQWDISAVQFAREIEKTFLGVAVITGFIASDEEKQQTTLGRNGSDFSASIFAALSKADQLTIWTDVDGVMSADPNKVPEARIIESLSYNEAMELAYFGAKVIHPQTLGPAIDNGVSIYIRNTFNPEFPGSCISDLSSADEKIKGITAINDMALINLEGTGMIGVPGTADRLFRALKYAGISVTLISQASSEHSICIAVPAALADRAERVVNDAFAEELAGGQIQRVDTTRDQSVIALVGDGMAGSPGIAARFFGNLGRAGINIRAIAQGSSERNISAVVNSTEVTRALRAVHSGFYLSAKTISVGLIGPGVVGSALLEQLYSQADRLKQQFNLDLRIRAISRSQRMHLGDRQIPASQWRQCIANDGTDTDFDAFEAHVNADHLPHSVIIDCSADQTVAERYAGWLANGIHVVTPNKKAFSGRQAYFDDLRQSARTGNSHFLYETTVCAALPVLGTARELIDTGDRIHNVQGILSGTLAYLFNVYDGSRPFSQIVAEARASGFTEPDPRDDLSGMDVARKLTILAREFGQRLEIDDFPVENLVDENLREMPVDEFLNALKVQDDAFLARYHAAQDAGNVLRYIASLDADGKARVGLQEVAQDHPFSNVKLTDNIVQFTTQRYSDNPLVIQGPGAGPEVTASGIFGDLLKLSAYLGSGH